MLPKGCTVTSRSCTTASTCRNYRLQPRTVLHGAPAMPDIEDFQDDDTCCCTLPRQYGKPVLTCVQLLGIVLLFYMVYGAITCSVVIALVLFSFVGILTAIAYIFTVFFLPMSVVLLLLGFILRYTIGVVSADQQYSGVWFLFRRWLYDRFLLSFPYRLAVRVLTQEGTSFPLYCRLMGITLGWGAWMGRHYIRMGSNLFSAGSTSVRAKCCPKLTVFFIRRSLSCRNGGNLYSTKDYHSGILLCACICWRPLLFRPAHCSVPLCSRRSVHCWF